MLTIFGYDSLIHKCVYCDNAKRLATVKKLPYVFHSVVTGKNEDDLIFDESVIKDMLGRLDLETKDGLTMPQVFWHGVHIGGFDDMKNAFQQGVLK